MSIANTINSINNHIENIYDTLEIAGTNTSAISNNIVNINSSLKERLKYYLANGVDVVWENWDKVSGSGTTIILNNTIPSKLKMQLNGSTSQKTTQGNQLLDLSSPTTYTSGGTYTFTNDVLTFSTTSAGGTYTNVSFNITDLFKNNAGKKLKFVFDSINMTSYGSGTVVQLNVQHNDSTPTDYIALVNNAGTSLSGATIPDDTTNVSSAMMRIYTNNANSTGNYSISITKPMLQFGTQAKDYEKYTGGNPAPNPDYPQEVEVVKGNNKVVVCGKNILDSSIFRQGGMNARGQSISTGVSSFTNTEGTITFTTTASYRGCISEYIKILPSTNYSLSFNRLLTSNLTYKGVIYWYDKNKNYLSNGSGDNGYSGVSPNNAEYAIIDIYIIETSTGSINNIQLEANQSATTYEPYQSQEYEIDLPVENLFNTSTQGYSDTGVTTQIIDNNNVIITYNGESGAYKRARFIVNGLKINTDYTFRANIKNTNSSVTANWLIVYEGTTNLYNASYTSGNVVTFNTGENTSVVVTLYVVGSTAVTNNTAIWSNIQLEEGSKANKYTPYGTTPIELCKIGDYQDYFRKSTGKNLFSGYTKGIKINATDGSQYSDNTGATSDYIPLDITSNNTFILSGTPNNLYNFIGAYNSNKQFLGRTGAKAEVTRILANDSFIGGTPQGTGDIAYIRVTIYENPQVSGNINDIDNAKIQLEQGSQITTYEPYGKVWCKYKELGKVTLNGSETYESMNWGSEHGEAWRTPINDMKLMQGSATETLLYSNLFKYYVGSVLNTTEKHYGMTNRNNLAQVVLKYPEATSSSDFAQWVSNNNVELYYPLATPTNEAITDTTLINQLDELEKAMSYQGTTNISQDNNDESFIIDATTLTELGSITVTRSQPLLSTILVQDTTDGNEEENENNINKDISEEQPDEEINEEPEMR